MATKDDTRRGICFSPQKRRMFSEICKTNKGCVMKKIKYSDDDKINGDLVLSSYSTIAISELPYHKPEKQILPISSIAR